MWKSIIGDKMNCSKCGTLNNENARFCIKCGNALGAATVPNAIPNSNINQNNFVAPQQNVNNVQMVAAPQVAQPQTNKSSFNFVKSLLFT